MKIQLSNELKVGLLSILALVIFYYGYNYLKGRNVLSSQNDFVVVYDRIDGLLGGNNILLNGYRIGLVESIDMLTDGSGKIVVHYSIDKEIPIPKGSVAQIVDDGLMGDKAVYLLISNSKELHQNGDTLIGEVQASLANSFKEEIMPLKDNINALVLSLDSTTKSLNKIVGSGEIEANLAALKKTLHSFDATAQSVNGLVNAQEAHIAGILRNVESLTQSLENNRSRIDAIMQNSETASRKLASLDYDKSVANLNQTLASTNTTIVELQKSLRQLNEGDGSMSLLLKNPDLYNNLTQTTESIDQLLTDMRLNPKRYVHFSLFGRKEKTNNTATPEQNIPEE
ncbi:MAG: MlaD family protein [Chitinophagales bacterium]|nr:MCE family protein [Bacteroidota bacterium]MCB9043113.1 MCE family protein [Chitinophagales bacterium]